MCSSAPRSMGCWRRAPPPRAEELRASTPAGARGMPTGHAILPLPSLLPMVTPCGLGRHTGKTCLVILWPRGRRGHNKRGLSSRGTGGGTGTGSRGRGRPSSAHLLGPPVCDPRLRLRLRAQVRARVCRARL